MKTRLRHPEQTQLKEVQLSRQLNLIQAQGQVVHRIRVAVVVHLQGVHLHLHHRPLRQALLQSLQLLNRLPLNLPRQLPAQIRMERRTQMKLALQHLPFNPQLLLLLNQTLFRFKHRQKSLCQLPLPFNPRLLLLLGQTLFRFKHRPKLLCQPL